MKTKQISFIIFISLSYFLNAQNFKVSDLIKLNNSVPVENPDSTLTVYSDDLNSDKKLKYLEANVIFRILEISDNYVKLMAIPFTNNKQKKEINRLKKRINALEEKDETTLNALDKVQNASKYKSDYYNDKVYTISLKNFSAFAESFKYEDRISIGLLTLPFRARPQDEFSFDTEFNLSTSINFRIGQFVGSSFNWQFGAGISSIGLNPENSNGVTGQNSQDVSALTLFTGPMLQYKKVQIGLYIGVDQINNQSNYQWKSNGNLWLGFGVGFNVFTASLSTSKNGQ